MRISPRPESPCRDRRGIVRTALVVALMAMSLATPSTAYAAEEGSLCADGGVSIVVDFKDLGGGVQQACDESGAGKVASKAFEDAGFELTPVGAFPGAACRVDGKPADAACAKMPPANAYWGLYLGTNGKWDYAPKGADELTLKDGDFVGFAWQASATSSPPAVLPVAPPAEEPDTATSSDDTEEKVEEDGGIPWWVPVLVVVALAVGGAGIALRRRGAGSL